MANRSPASFVRRAVPALGVHISDAYTSRQCGTVPATFPFGSKCGAIDALSIAVSLTIGQPALEITKHFWAGRSFWHRIGMPGHISVLQLSIIFLMALSLPFLIRGSLEVGSDEIGGFTGNWRLPVGAGRWVLDVHISAQRGGYGVRVRVRVRVQ